MLIAINVRVDLSDKAATHVAALAAVGDGHSAREKAAAVLRRTIQRAVERLRGDLPDNAFVCTLAVQPVRALEADEQANAERLAAAGTLDTAG